jgi:uncharacterized protein (TIGR02301 family)
LIGTVLAVAFAAAGAEPAPPAPRQAKLLQLAFVLGEAHALRQACAPEDQTWRSRMQRMLEVEAPDTADEAALAQRFNDGFAARRAQFPRCVPLAAAAEAKIAAEGKALAEALAQSP